MTYKNLIVLGSGESGVGTALLGKSKGFNVFVSDKSKIKVSYKHTLTKHGISWEEGKHTPTKILNSTLIMKSPGIPENAPIIQQARRKGIEIVSEIEFASRYTEATIVAVTGSNGKTTTSTLAYHILSQAKNVGLAGNIGNSFAKEVFEKDLDTYVLEVSSFQLDDINSFKPHIAIITTIIPDHLDRYNNQFEKYIAAKFNIVKFQTEEDYLIYNADDKVITNWLESNAVKPQLIPFSTTREIKNGASLKNDKIILTIKKKTFIMPTKNLQLKGIHNVKNAMAASATARLLNIRKQTIRESLENFHGIEHRLEQVLTINKVKYINDSKATNVNATYYALKSMESPTIWIVGGVDKGNNYEELYPVVNEKVKAIIFLGKDNEKLKQNFSAMVDVSIETQYISEAVKIAYKLAESGDNVLLSPACASFDLFDNYEDRGRQFKDAVRNL